MATTIPDRLLSGGITSASIDDNGDLHVCVNASVVTSDPRLTPIPPICFKIPLKKWEQELGVVITKAAGRLSSWLAKRGL